MSSETHPFTLRQLQYIVAVADTLGFRLAAERCHVSQPSLSAQVALLESQLGVQLFERNRQRVLITSGGRPVIERARLVLQAADDLVQQTRADDPLQGRLEIGVIPTISPYLLPSLSAAMRRRLRRLQVLWTEDKTEALLDRLLRGSLDAVVIAEVPTAPTLDHAALAFDEFVVAAPASHPLMKRGRGIGPAELRGVDVLLLDDGHCFREQALAVCHSARADELAFRATSLTTLAQMVAGGAGITLLPSLAVATEAKRARLAIRHFIAPAPGRTITLVWRRGSPLIAALQAIAEIAREAWPATTKKPKPRTTTTKHRS